MPPPAQLGEVGADVEGVLAAPVHPAHAARDEHLDAGQVGHLAAGGPGQRPTSMVPDTVVPPCSLLAST